MPPHNLQSISNEANIQLAIQAIDQGQIPSVQAAAKTFNVSKSTLQRRTKGTTSPCDSIPTNRKLTLIEEEVIVQYVLDLILRGFAPKVNNVEDMAKYYSVQLRYNEDNESQKELDFELYCTSTTS